LFSTQAEGILNHVNPNVQVLDKEKLDIGSIRGINLAAVRPMAVHLTHCSLRVVT
jgi:hypothetical protein